MDRLSIASRPLVTNSREDERILITALATVLYHYTRQDEIEIALIETLRSQTKNSLFEGAQLFRYDLDPKVQLQHLLATEPKGPCVMNELRVSSLEWNPGKEFRTCLIRSQQPTEKVKARLEAELSGQWVVVTIEESTRQYNTISLLFSHDVFPQKQAQRALQQITCAVLTLEEEASSGKQKTLCQIEVVNSEEKTELQEWNKANPYGVAAFDHTSQDESLPSLVASQASQTPSSTAIDAWDGVFSYEELERHADFLARQLIQQGHCKGEIVPLCFEKSRWTTVAALATLKAGGVVTFVDPSYPDTRVEAILRATGASTVLTGRSQTLRLQGMVNRVIEVTTETQSSMMKTRRSKALADAAETEVLTGTEASDPAFILFTSGSTGIPKGIIQSHRAACHTAMSSARRLGITPVSRVLQFSGYAFDVNVIETFMALCAGACLCIPSEDDRMTRLAASSNAMGVNFAFLTPSTARSLYPWELPSLRTLVLVGEAVPPDLHRRWTGHQVRLINGYGPAECSLCAVWVYEEMQLQSNVIGMPLNATCWIASRDDPTLLAPLGTVGELHVSGPLLASGYLNDEKGSRQRFLRRSSYLEDDEVVFRTGDLARVDENGTLVFIGRADTMVKLRGQRIELAEVEHYLTTSFDPQLQWMVDVVTPLGNKESRPFLTAFVTVMMKNDEKDLKHNKVDFLFPTKETTLVPSINAIQEALLQSLPKYMIPQIVLAVTRIPLTATQKSDRKRLKEMASSLTMLRISEFMAVDGASDKEKECLHGGLPRNDQEGLLQQLWATVLSMEVNEIKINDNFFLLGADSVSVMRLAALAHKKGHKLSFQDITKHPTLIKMAERLSTAVMLEGLDNHQRMTQEQSSTNSDSRIGVFSSVCHARQALDVTKEEIVDIYPCTPFQEGLLAIAASDPSMYVARFTFELPTVVKADDVDRAWKVVLAKNEILRTVFLRLPTGEILQVVLSSGSTMRTFPSYSAFMETRVKDPLSVVMLSSGKIEAPIRLSLLEEHSHLLVLEMHHVFYDGWSLGIMLDQLDAALGNHRPVRNVSAMSRFVNYVTELDQLAATQYWKSMLTGTQSATFPPLPFEGYAAKTNETARLEMELPQPSNQLQRTYEIQLAWAVTVAQYTGNLDVTFGLTINGRFAPLPDIMDLAAPTICSVPIRVVFTRQTTLADSLQALQEISTTRVPHEQIGLAAIRKSSEDAALACKFQCVMAIQPVDEYLNGTYMNLGRLEKARSSHGESQPYALTLECCKTTKGMRICAGYDSLAVLPERVLRILQQFRSNLQAIATAAAASNMSAHLWSLCKPSIEDMQLLRQWNGYGVSTCCMNIHDLIAQQALDQPESQAVDSWDARFTYRELNEYADRFAIMLSTILDAASSSRQKVIPMCFEKSAWTVAAMLGILKAGYAFCMLDPAHPLPRLKSIAEDLDTEIIVSSQLHESLARLISPNVVILHPKHVTNSSKECTLRALDSDCQPSDPAYVIFSSGSTGTPKGVLIPHYAFATSAMAHRQGFHIDKSSRVLQFASYAFDACLVEILTPLIAGACVCVLSDHQRINEFTLATTALEPTVAFLTPSLLRTMAPADLPTLKTIILNGEAVDIQVLNTWVPHRTIVNAYGPCECSVVCAINAVVDLARHPGNIGYSVGGTCWVVDSENHNFLVPIGAVGELVVEGPIVGSGYLKRPQLTAQLFIEPPGWLEGIQRLQHNDIGRARLYKTGDLVRQEVDGSMVYLGRKDTQVKIRGQRVELREIEANIFQLLQDVGAGANVFVEAVKPKASETSAAVCLVAFILCPLSQGETVHSTNSEIITPSSSVIWTNIVRRIVKALQQTIPVFMIPNYFVPLTRVPLMVSKKADRRLLRDIFQKSPVGKQMEWSIQTVQPREQQQQNSYSKTGLLLREIWAEALRIPCEQLGPMDNFFSLGGDSILAMKLVGIARRKGLVFSVPQMLKRPTIAQLEQELCSSSSSSPLSTPDSLDFASNSASSITTSVSMPRSCCYHDFEGFDRLEASGCNVLHRFPATDYQTVAFRLVQSKSRSMLNHFVVSLSGPLDVDRFQQASIALIAVCDILRTVLAVSKVPGEPLMQLVLDGLPPDKVYSHVKTLDVDQFTDRLIWMDRTRGISSCEPLIKITTVEPLSPADHGDHHRHRVIIKLIHTHYDGISMPLVLEALSQLYRTGKSSVALTTWSEYMTSSPLSTESAQTYWRKYLVDSTPTTILTGYCPANGEKITNSSFTQLVLLPTPKSSLLQPHSLSSIIEACWAMTLARWTGARDVLFWRLSAGRTDPRAENVVGSCLVYVPVRVIIDPLWSPLETINVMQEAKFASLPYENIGHEAIGKACGWPTPLPKFPSLVQHQNIVEVKKMYLTEELQGQVIDLGPMEDAAEINILTRLDDRGRRLVVSLSCYEEETIHSLDDVKQGGRGGQALLDSFCGIMVECFGDDEFLTNPQRQ